MAAKTAAEDSSSSDESMKGFPNFSAEEDFSEGRALPDHLLNNSKEFIRLYEKHQPELQQVLNDLKKSSYEFLDKYEKAAKDSKSGGENVVIGASVGTALAVLFMGPAAIAGITAAGILSAAPGSLKSYRGNKNKQEEEKKVKTELKNALKKFNKTTDTVANCLKNICNDVEMILQYKDDEQSRSIKRELKHLRKSAEDLSELAKLFTPEDLQRLLEQGKRTVYSAENISPQVSDLLLFLGFLFIFEDNRTLRDFAKLKRRPSVREEELESKAGKFICKMRETTINLQNTLNELRTSKSEVEIVILCKLNSYLNP